MQASRLRPGFSVVLAMAALLAGVAAPSPPLSQPRPEWHADLEPFVDGLVTTVMDQSAVAGAVVAIVSADEVLLQKGYRLADPPSGRRVDAEAELFPVASVTKVFTALSVLILIDEGLIDPAQTVGTYLPDVALDQEFGAITIADLLGHTGGLEERHFGYLALPETLLAQPASDQLSAILPRQVRPPGEVIGYSNAGYILLGEVIARVSGMPYEAFVKAHILDPLNMGASGFPGEAGASALNDALAGAWVWGDGRYLSSRRPPFPRVHAASGGLASTAGDMVRFMQAQLASGRPPWPDRVTDQMRTPLTPGRPEFAARTWGYWHETWAGRAVFQHEGGAFGIHSTLVMVPEENLAIFVAANGPSGAALKGLPRRLLRELIHPEGVGPATSDASAGDSLVAYAGRYISTRRNDTGFGKIWMMDAPRMEVVPIGEDALLVTGLGYHRRFLPEGPDRFVTPEGDMRLAFRRSVAGDVHIADLDGGLHSFDRMGYWQGAWSFLTGAIAAVLGVVLSGPAARAGRPGFARWFRFVAVVWGLLILIAGSSTLYLFGTPSLTRMPEPPMILWVLTGVVWLGALATFGGIAALVRTAGAPPPSRLARPAAVLALAVQIWALYVLWQWNILTLSPLW